MNLVIYHGGCTDGVAAAYAAYQQLPGATYFPGVYQQEPPWEAIHAVNVGERLYLVDFSYKRPVMEKIRDNCRGECWILDHHKTALEDCGDLLRDEEWQGEFDLDRSGALIAWDHFVGGQRPWQFEHIDARDRWLDDRPAYNNEFTFALRTVPHFVHPGRDWHWLMRQWEKFMNRPYNHVMMEGAGIHRYFRTLVDQAKEWRCEWIIGGRVMPVVNAPYFLASEVAGELSEQHESGMAACYWIDAAKGVVIFSLRTRRQNLDVSELAKCFGGGGHPGAAGFSVKLGYREDGRILFDPDDKVVEIP